MLLNESHHGITTIWFLCVAFSSFWLDKLEEKISRQIEICDKTRSEYTFFHICQDYVTSYVNNRRKIHVTTSTYRNSHHSDCKAKYNHRSYFIDYDAKELQMCETTLLSANVMCVCVYWKRFEWFRIEMGKKMPKERKMCSMYYYSTFILFTLAPFQWDLFRKIYFQAFEIEYFPQGKYISSELIDTHLSSVV